MFRPNIHSLIKEMCWLIKIDKKEYLDAMSISPSSSKQIFMLIKNALASDFQNRELIIKCIDYSYYYE